MIERIFKNIPDGNIDEADQHSFLVNLGWSRGTTWNNLLRSRRVLMISEAGAGKTYECRAQAQRLWDEGEPAFFVELAALAAEDLASLLDVDEEARLNAWLSSQSEVATFFLDSIDELKLSQGSFERALKRLKRSIGSQLRRARIVITTRPIPADEQLVRQLLPVPPAPMMESREEKFAKIAMGDYQQQHEDKSSDDAPEWRSVALMPLSDKQIIEFAREQGINDPDSLLSDLQRRNAQEFARRPQDLIELCADWREHKRIRTHRDQVTTNVRVKLLPRDDRPEPAELSVDKALEGAARLALAMQMTRRLTIRHNAASDVAGNGAALEPTIILSDWQPNERRALLERPLFGFASYGRVRFHHRSVAEFLAAQHLLTLRQNGMTFPALKRLLFAETNGKLVVRPSKRPVAGWLALNENGIFELLRDNEPAVLLNEGDPESLSQAQRNQALRAYYDRYGSGGWRGLHVPHIQVYRFASNELAGEINRIWRGGVENSELRYVLISLIEAGRISACADVAYNLACEGKTPVNERIAALDALVAMDDERLAEVVSAMARAYDLWPRRVVSSAALRLFPKHMSVGQLCQTLQWMKGTKFSAGSFSWQLPKLLATSEIDFITLAKLRDGLVMLVSEGLNWQNEWPNITTDRPHLIGGLAATCLRGIDGGRLEEWLHACVLALRLSQSDHGEDEVISSLRERLADFSAADSARLFWAGDTMLQALHEIKDPSERLSEITICGGAVQLRSDRDLAWISTALAETTRDQDERALLLSAAMSLPPDHDSWVEHVEKLSPLVADEPAFLKRIDECLKPSIYEEKSRHREARLAERRRQKEQQKVENHASWTRFWGEVANQPEVAFSPGQDLNTAWDLWRVMRNDDNSRSAGWNRRFIEDQFGKATADKLRHVLMTVWRANHPTFASERPEGERNTFLVRWQLGLAAIYAEAEDAEWANKLSDSEARLAIRYAPMELSGLPQWMEALVHVHPIAVGQTLGSELSRELDQPPGSHGHSSLLQAICYAPETVARLFLTRLGDWLDANGDRVDDASNLSGMSERVRQLTGAILKHGDESAIENLLETARQRLNKNQPSELRDVWLSTLMRIDPASGVTALEVQLAGVEPAARTEAVTWLANLFGDRRDTISLNDACFTPPLLLRLLRLAYRHVQIKDDAQHEGSWTPDIRDDAERARNAIVAAIFNLKGEDGLNAKLEMAADPLCEHFKDRILAVAEENWAQEIDAGVYDEAQAVALNRCSEAAALTNEAMFAILKDRLANLDDLLLRDGSPRELWAGISNEKMMRREIARELSYAANSIYTVDQEAVTADEKETDIRLRSAASDHQAVIELKLGDGRTAEDLLNTIESQLVRKYMAAENSRAGALMVSLAEDRKWNHPDESRRIDVDELFTLLRIEAERVQEASGGTVSVAVHFLDLRPRLPLEKDRKPKKTKV